MVVPSVSMARLLPLAVRVDPDRSSEYLWRAIAARPPRAAGAVHGRRRSRSGGTYLVLAQLAALVARYDREAAETIFAPVAENAPALIDDRFDLSDEAGAILQAAAAFDPRAALAMVDALPEDPEPKQGPRPGRPPAFTPRIKEKARLAVARALALPPGARRREALAGPRPVRPLARRARRLIPSSRIAIEETAMRIGPRRIPRAAALFLALAPLVVAVTGCARAGRNSAGASIRGGDDPRPAPTGPAVDAPRDVAAPVPGPGVGHAVRTGAGRPARRRLPGDRDRRRERLVERRGSILSTHGWVLPEAPAIRPGSRSPGAGWSTRPSPSARRPTWRPT